jgi:class 3 adenylate cyclase
MTSSSTPGTIGARPEVPPATERPTRNLRRSLAARLTVLALLATIVLGSFNFLETRSLLGRATEAQLTNQQRSQAQAIGNGLGFVGDAVSVIAGDPATIRALSELSGAVGVLESDPDLLGSDEAEALGAYYATAVAAGLTEAGLDPASAGTAPAGTAGYLQYHYLVSNPFPPGDRDQLEVAPGDDSSYGVAHATHHSHLNRQRRDLGFSDLLLVDVDGTIVYTSAKRTDLGRNIADVPSVGTALETLIEQQLAAAAFGDPAFADFHPYPPAFGEPTLFAAATLLGTEGAIGTVVVQLPIATLNLLTTADRQWPAIGLGETGETYVVGRDLLLRSDSRLWLEDPEAYLAIVERRYSAGLAEAVARYGTTVLQQPVDTEPVASAFDGEPSVGRSRDYLGRSVIAAAAPVDVRQLDWALVAQIGTGEAGDPLGSYILTMLITAAILVPLVALAGLLVAGLFIRPFGPVVVAARRIASGDLDVEIPDLGKNELGDVARRLGDIALHLREQEEAIAAEEAETTRLLLSALPPRLVERIRESSEEVTDLVDSASIVSVIVTGVVDDPSVDADRAVELASMLSRELEAAAEPLGLERIRSSSDQHVFAAGLDRPTSEVERAAEFALQVGAVLETFADETGLDPSYRIGISSGRVISGLLASDQLTYGVFGEPPQTSIALSAIAAPGRVLIDRSAARELDETFEIEEVEGLVDLRGRAVEAGALVGRRRDGDDDRPEG